MIVLDRNRRRAPWLVRHALTVALVGGLLAVIIAVGWAMPAGLR